MVSLQYCSHMHRNKHHQRNCLLLSRLSFPPLPILQLAIPGHQGLNSILPKVDLHHLSPSSPRLEAFTTSIKSLHSGNTPDSSFPPFPEDADTKMYEHMASRKGLLSSDPYSIRLALASRKDHHAKLDLCHESA